MNKTKDEMWVALICKSNGVTTSSLETLGLNIQTLNKEKEIERIEENECKNLMNIERMTEFINCEQQAYAESIFPFCMVYNHCKIQHSAYMLQFMLPNKTESELYLIVYLEKKKDAYQIYTLCFYQWNWWLMSHYPVIMSDHTVHKHVLCKWLSDKCE